MSKEMLEPEPKKNRDFEEFFRIDPYTWGIPILLFGMLVWVFFFLQRPGLMLMAIAAFVGTVIWWGVAYRRWKKKS